MMRDQLRRDTVSGVGWAFLSSTSLRIFQAVTTLVLAKLLVPSDFGVYTLSTLIIYAIVVFRDVGFAQVLIYQQGDAMKSASTAFFLSLASSVVLAVLLFASAPLLGRAFSTAEIVLPVRAMAVSLVISGAANVPVALLDKQLKFKKRVMPEVVSAFTYASVSIILAVMGFRAWSLIIGWIAMSIVNSIAMWMVCGWKPALEFDRREARVIVGYGKHLMVASLATFLFFQIDNASVGKLLGLRALGFYSMAFTVCNLPATNLSNVVNRVMFPTYSRLQLDMPEMRAVYLQTVKYIAMAAFPAAIGIFVIADPVIRVFYGAKWIPAIPLFHILALYGLIRSIGSTASAVFMSTGNPGLVRRVSALQLLIALPLVYTVAMKAGAMGVAVLFTCAYLFGTVYSLGKVRGILDIRVRQYVKAVSLPLGASVLAGVFGWAASLAVGPASWSGIAVNCVMFGSVYGASVFLLDKSVYGELAGLLRKSRE